MKKKLEMSGQNKFSVEAQRKQDDIFMKMSADRKIDVGSQLWWQWLFVLK